jgi:hypothetical protein
MTLACEIQSSDFVDSGGSQTRWQDTQPESTDIAPRE